MYDGFKSTYSFNKDGHKIVLAPMKLILLLESKKEEESTLFSKAKIEKEVKEGCDLLSWFYWRKMKKLVRYSWLCDIFWRSFKMWFQRRYHRVYHK